ncbi:MAG: uroporphyrinogen decarboxylase family protein [Bacillota bacterium]|nr:uroporphyrinogen decarboxylase family protein [Bacillota bacterium]
MTENMTAEERVRRAVSLQEPDRVPVILAMDSFAARQKGMSLAEFTSDYDRARDTIIEVWKGFGADGVLAPSPATPFLFTLLWGTRVKVPGKEFPDQWLWQLDESQPFMQVEDYDLVVQKGFNHFLVTLGCRILQMSPGDVVGRLQWHVEKSAEDVRKWREAGAFVLCASAAPMPFDSFSGARTFHQFILDLYRYPDKVQAAIEASVPDVVESAKLAVKVTGIPGVFLGATRACGGLVNLKIFERFFLPSLKQVVEALVADGITPLLHFDQDWTKNLPYFRELPRAKCILHLDGFTDIFKAKEILGDHMCLKGDVHPTMLVLGSMEEVEDYTRQLIDRVGRGGGFILSQGCDIPPDARPENVRAMVETARTYGVYGRNGGGD